MFERFTKAARTVVVLAQEDARQRRAEHIGSEHLLLGLLGVPGAPAATLLEQAGVDRQAVEAALGDRSADAEALAAIGIDLDEVRRRAEEAFGPGALDRGRRWRAGHVPFDAAAKKVLELALREAVRRGDRHIGTEHVLLGLLHRETGEAQRILAAHGLTLELVRRAVDELGRGAASG